MSFEKALEPTDPISGPALIALGRILDGPIKETRDAIIRMLTADNLKFLDQLTERVSKTANRSYKIEAYSLIRKALPHDDFIKVCIEVGLEWLID